MNKLGKILLTDGAYKHTLAAAISLKKAGYEVHVMGRKTNVCRFSFFVDKFIPNKYFYQYHIDELLVLLSAENYDVILPVSGKSVKFLSIHSEKLLKLSNFLISDTSRIETALDKISSSKIAHELSIDTIPSAFSDNLEELYVQSKTLKFPLVLKSKDELKKSSVYYVTKEADLKRAICKYYATYDFLPLVQQYIEGEGLGYFSLNKNGIPLLNFAHKRIREAPATGGVSSCAEYYDGLDVVEYGKKLMSKLGWDGLSMVEFKRDNLSGKLYLMEINPKLWGSLDLAIECLADFPLKYVEYCMGNDIKTIPSFKPIRFSWIASEEILHIFTRIESFKLIMIDLFSRRVKTNFRLNDPLPTLHFVFISLFFSFKFLLRKNNLSKHFGRLRRTGIKYFAIRFFTETFGVPLLNYGKISNKIFIGGQPSKIGIKVLSLLGFTHCINLRDEFIYNSNEKITIINFPTVEFDFVNSEDLSKISSNIINLVNNSNAKVYIHCTEGVGRAPMIGVACLMSMGNDLESSIRIVKSSRPFVSFVKLQKESLKDFYPLNR
jgi:predicted ATP-grasp superfamily ATP-dependent carboligase